MSTTKNMSEAIRTLVNLITTNRSNKSPKEIIKDTVDAIKDQASKTMMMEAAKTVEAKLPELLAFITGSVQMQMKAIPISKERRTPPKSFGS